MEIISVNIQKGGSGKTTSVQAIAEILNRDYGKKILCIDLDPQCNLTTVSGIDIMQYQDNNMYTLLKEAATLQECIVPTKYYDIIPGSSCLMPKLNLIKPVKSIFSKNAYLMQLMTIF